MIGRGLMILGALLVFGGVNWQMQQKERLRTTGKIVYLELAPVDPRSLMQGDYMALNFTLSRQIGAAMQEREGPGVAVLTLDNRRQGTLARIDNGQPLAPNEVRFRFRQRNGMAWLGTNAFFFHEGEAERYRGSHYGEFRVSEDGDAVLVDLRFGLNAPAL